VSSPAQRESIAAVELTPTTAPQPGLGGGGGGVQPEKTGILRPQLRRHSLGVVNVHDLGQFVTLSVHCCLQRRQMH